MDKKWIKLLRKNLKPRGMAFMKDKFIFSKPYTDQYLQRPPVGCMNWDKDALDETQKTYMINEISEIIKKNEDYLYFHPQVMAILCMLMQSFAHHQPGDVRKHMKQVLKDPLLIGKVNLFLLERDFKKTDEMKAHEEEVIEASKNIDKHYEGYKYYTECFRSELPQPKETIKCFERNGWMEPYPDYLIKKYKTLQGTMPHFIRYTEEIYPLKPAF